MTDLIEQTAKEVYERSYKIAEIRENSEYTKNLAYNLHLTFVNELAAEGTEIISEDSRRLITTLKSLDEEFFPKFEELAKKQTRNR